MEFANHVSHKFIIFVLIGTMLPACHSGSVIDPDELPQFGVRTTSHGHAEPNVDPQNEGIVVTRSFEGRFYGHELQLPGGASRSARCMLDWLQARPDQADGLSGANVLELGSGTGLAGMAAVILGARVHLTDQSVVMETLRENVSPNLRPEQINRVRFEELVWGPIDHAHPLMHEKYDVILAADVVYAKESIMPLVATLRHFSQSHTVIYLAYVHRFPWAREFFDRMNQTHTRKLIWRRNGVWIFEFHLRRGVSIHPPRSRRTRWSVDSF